MLRAIGFDLDGTLFDHRGSSRAAFDAFTGSLGVGSTGSLFATWERLEQEHFEAWRSGAITFGEQRRRRLRGFLDSVAIDVPGTDDELDVLFGQYLAADEASWRIFDDVVPTLRSLRHRGIAVGVLTNGNAGQQRAKLARTGLVEMLDVVCISEEIGASKPERAAFEALTAALAVPPAEAGFVGDNHDQDVSGARRAGLSAVLIDRYGQTAPADLASAIRAL
jgi:putative hydrolase of the HAD superfamily